MIASLIAAMALNSAPMAHDVIDLNPLNDAWIYAHAGDPQTDEFLRVWGQEDAAVPADPNDRDNFSYSYLSFDLERCPTDKKLEAAELILTHVADPGFKLDDTKKAPVQVRPLVGTFTEKGWNYDLGAKVYPAPKKEDVFGEGSPAEIPQGQPFEVSINLLKGPNSFKVYLGKAIEGKEKTLFLSITSKIDPSQIGRAGIYKFFSKDHKENAKRRPLLRLTFDDGSVQNALPTRLK